MNKYKYRTTNKVNPEIWVCEACKKGKIDSILTGNWKLIDRSADPKILCAVCEGAGDTKNSRGIHIHFVHGTSA